MSYSQELKFTDNHRRGLFFAGASCMVLSGYFLVMGLSYLSTSYEQKVAWIASGIVFQGIESICFILAGGLPKEFKKIRWAAFIGGIVMLLYSIAVVTYAQKVMMQDTEKSANASDSLVNSLDDQIKNLDQTIQAYQLNSKNQSKSRFAQSRKLAKESLDKATGLMEKRDKLVAQKYELEQNRVTSAIDVFAQLEDVVGIKAADLELGFNFTRSLLLEGGGVLLLALAGFLSSMKRQSELKKEFDKEKKEERPAELTKKENGEKTQAPQQKQAQQATVTPISSRREIKKPAPQQAYSEAAITDMAMKIIILLDEKKIKAKGRDVVKDALLDHYDTGIGAKTAMRVSKKVKELLKKQNSENTEDTGAV